MKRTAEALLKMRFVKGQEVIAQEKAAEDLQQAAMVAAETIDLANQLAADNDSHKKRLAALIKDTVVGAVEVATGRLPAEEGRAIEAGSPFSGDSQTSRTSLPDSTAPRQCLVTGPGQPSPLTVPDRSVGPRGCHTRHSPPVRDHLPIHAKATHDR